MAIDTDTVKQTIQNGIPDISHLEVTDDSDGCGEKYAVLIVSEAFQGKSTLARHRWINELLREEIAQMHAFSQKTFTPQQYQTYLANKS